MPSQAANEAASSNVTTSSHSSAPPSTPSREGYVVIRWLLLRSTALLYLIAFLVALNQGPALIGSQGLLPYGRFVRMVEAHYRAEKKSAWMEVPSVFFLMKHIAPYLPILADEDVALKVVCWVGVVLSVAALVGVSNAVTMMVLWAAFMSVVNVGQVFWGYGWEMQLLETGVLGVWLSSLWSVVRAPAESSATTIVIWLYRWLIIRIMLGAGLIKLRGDACWRNLTCLLYHYETQPIPNPISFYLHHMPRWVHVAGVLTNHFVELVAPFMLLLPLPESLLHAAAQLNAVQHRPWYKRWSLRPARLMAGMAFVGFQLMLLLSGNLSYLNYLTVIPALACWDDSFVCWLCPPLVVVWRRLIANSQSSARSQQSLIGRIRRYSRLLMTMTFAALVVYLSVPVVQNLMGDRQMMNASFDRLKIVNTYGAFGSVGKVRHEVIIEGTNESVVKPSTKWVEYQFKCKPGAVSRRPCIVAPYHLRLDWQIWFAAMGVIEHNGWLVKFVAKLLQNDEQALGLLAQEGDEWAAHRVAFGHSPPKFIRASLYEYKFATKLDGNDWWERRFVRSYLSPLSLQHEGLQRFLREDP